MASWQGTDYNERLFNSVRNMLVAVYLDGVRGVSPDRGHEWKMVPPEDADRYIAKARIVYAKLVDQKPPRTVKSWHEHKVTELDGIPVPRFDYSDYRSLLGAIAFVADVVDPRSSDPVVRQFILEYAGLVDRGLAPRRFR
jgi:hypothetical protein